MQTLGARIAVVVALCLILPFRDAATEESKLPLSGTLGGPALQPTAASDLEVLRAFGLAQREPNTPPLSLGSTSLSYPEWLKRVDLSIQHGSEKPRYYIETVQPLYQSRDQTYTFFVQPRISSTDEDWTANLGLGYRQLFLDQQLLGGINTFYDYADNHNHYRLGVGLELLSRYLELRTNGYFPLSYPRRIG